MASQWTPGPWLVAGHRVHTPVDTTDTCVAVCAGDMFDAASYEECLANARLIAAAPELAVMLARITDNADPTQVDADASGVADSILDDARALLTKINGEA